MPKIIGLNHSPKDPVRFRDGTDPELLPRIAPAGLQSAVMPIEGAQP